MTLILVLLVPLIFAALPVGLSANVRRYKQAVLILLVCLVTPVIVGVAAVGLTNSTVDRRRPPKPRGRWVDRVHSSRGSRTVVLRFGVVGAG